MPAVNALGPQGTLDRRLLSLSTILFDKTWTQPTLSLTRPDILSTGVPISGIHPEKNIFIVILDRYLHISSRCYGHSTEDLRRRAQIWEGRHDIRLTCGKRSGGISTRKRCMGIEMMDSKERVLERKS